MPEYPFSEQPFNQYYTDLGDGPHVLRVENNSTMRIDGFESQIDNPVQIVPSVEWYDDTPGGGTGAFNTPAGMLMGIAAGDINNDGLVEIVAPSDTFIEGGRGWLPQLNLHLSWGWARRWQWLTPHRPH